ncbi:MAG: tetratricopeptide repeat protein [Gemmatimonadota bacterium]
MDQDPIQERLRVLADLELVRALTLERDQNSARFLELGGAELERRGATLQQRLDRVVVRLDDGPEETVAIEAALRRLDGEVPLWSSLVCGNCLGEVMVLQRERRQWVIHHYAEERYGHSYLFPGRGPARDVLALFLRLESWRPMAGEPQNLDDWQTVSASETVDLIETVTEDLDEAEIPHVVQTPLFVPGEDSEWAVRVPAEWLDEAYEVLDQAEEDLVDLYEEVASLYPSGDRRRELELYDLLAQEDPDNPAVHYNRANVLLELRRPEEAADALVEAVALGLDQVQPDLELEDRRGGGLGGFMGIFAVLLRRTAAPAPASPAPRYPDFIDDAELLLERLAQQLRRSTRILHCLAAIARLHNDAARAEELWRRVLELDPDDRVAYFNLGYLHSERGEGDGEPQPP